MRRWLHAGLCRFRGELAVVAVSILWVILLTYPLILRLDRSIYAVSWHTDNPGGSWVIGIWSTWWTKTAWTAGMDWRIAPIIGAPFGADWRAAPFQYLSVYVTTGLAFVTGELVAHNLFILASFPLSALTAYWLSFEVTRDRRAAFVGGLAFAFSVYHWARTMQHFNMAMLQWVPLFLLALLRWSNRPTLWRGAGAGAAFALIVLDNYYYGYFMLFAAAAFLLARIAWSLWVERSAHVSRAHVVSGAAALGIAVILVLPFVLPIVSGMLSATSSSAVSSWAHGAGEAAAYSTQPWMYLVPSMFHPVWSESLSEFYPAHFRLNEQALYLGLIALGLAAWGWRRSSIELANRRLEREQLTLAAVFAALLWLSGPPAISIGPIYLPTPSHVLYDVLPMIRVLARLGGLATAALAPLAAIGVLQLVNRWPSRRNWITLLAAAAILFDQLYLPQVRNLDFSPTPAEYEWLAARPGDFIAVEYPIYRDDATKQFRYMFYQRLHQKRLFNGIGLGKDWHAAREELLDVTDANVPARLRELGIRYVLVHADRYNDPTSPGAADGPPPELTDIPEGLVFIKQFGPTAVYEVAPDSAAGHHLTSSNVRYNWIAMPVH